jgi:hypothetical protein
MQKFEDVVTHMQKNFENVEFLKTVSNVDYESFILERPLIPFDEEVISYLSSLSKTLNQDTRIREYPDVSTFAFFCRRANVFHLKSKYGDHEAIRLGRGMVFHIAPSNVAINFAFSLVASLLAGNTNIVRVPSKRFEQIDIIIDGINRLARDQKYSRISKRIVLVRYDRTNAATGQFSADCDVRVIWGGDETIHQIRRNSLKPRAFDLTFADRYSICAINADRLVLETDLNKIVLGFYNDTYLFDQNACTSPHLVVWVGSKSNVSAAQEMFWSQLHVVVKEKYTIQGGQAVDKIANFYSQAILTEGVSHISNGGNLLWRITLKDLSTDIENYRCSSGYFSEYHAEGLSELSKIVNSRYQTLAYYGFSKLELNSFIMLEKLNGIDRIVPIGRTTDFSLIWDGYNLIEALSRKVEII